MKGLFKPEDFVATQFSTREEKARFANHFCRFVSSGYKRTLFTKWFYQRLSMCFGHIAHYNINGFYSEFFSTTEGVVRFANITLRGGGYGSPEHTYCDVEQALSRWAKNTRMLEKAVKAHGEAVEVYERVELERLKWKYEGGAR